MGKPGLSNFKTQTAVEARVEIALHKEPAVDRLEPFFRAAEGVGLLMAAQLHSHGIFPFRSIPTIMIPDDDPHGLITRPPGPRVNGMESRLFDNLGVGTK